MANFVSKLSVRMTNAGIFRAALRNLPLKLSVYRHCRWTKPCNSTSRFAIPELLRYPFWTVKKLSLLFGSAYAMRSARV
jgi:hypothetical protein